MLDQLMLPSALQMARDGATRGMIVCQLCQQRIAPEVAGRIADRAIVAVLNQKRCAGVSCLALGTAFIVAAFAARAMPIEIPAWLCLCGSFLFFMGWKQATQRLYRTNPQRSRFT